VVSVTAVVSDITLSTIVASTQQSSDTRDDSKMTTTTPMFVCDMVESDLALKVLGSDVDALVLGTS